MFAIRTFALAALFTALMPFSALQAAPLPDDIRERLEKARATNDFFIMDTVRSALMEYHPEHTEAITRWPNTAPVEEEIADAAPVTVTIEKEAEGSNSWLDSVTDGWKGSVEAGLVYHSGNTEKEQLNANIELTKATEKWEHTIKAAALNTSEGTNTTPVTRSAEEYRLSGKSDYQLNDRHYLFGTLEYVNDRFSGYNWRISELLGYGYHIIKNDRMTLDAEISAGGRHSSIEENGITRTEHEPIIRMGGDFGWHITESLLFEQDFNVTHGRESVITESVTALKNDLTDHLFLRLAHTMEHLSDPPAGSESLDSVSSMTLGYEF